ncbi:hypothetical protein [Oligoflexus tunisiensis]|uniref:hypothetical protein n=1 Tax=Oligoflexus tunisiensis TaxID=708132 RepID=UPI00114D184F|nr:hypothetical protein [Oligoflexus tunisiensis]
MKINGIIVCTMGLLAQLAFAQEAALITKTNATGYTAPEHVRLETCELFLDKVIITNQYGADADSTVTSREVRNVTFSESIFNILEQAGAETLSSSNNYVCDGPTTSISSHHAGTDLVLFETGGCGSPRLERQGAASLILLDMITAYCPTVHDFGVQDTEVSAR